MRIIPPELRSLLERMPRMRTCELSYMYLDFGLCEGRIEWHHVFQYGSEGQINEMWSILGACTRHHAEVKTNRKVKEAFERRSLEIATGEELAKYPKKPWAQIIKYLNKI